MPEMTLVAGSMAAGALCAGSVFVACGRGSSLTARSWLPRRRWGELRATLSIALERAGWRESPVRVTGFGVALSASLGLLGATPGAALSPGGAAVICALGIAAGPVLPWLVLRSAAARRRRRLEGELVPLLELFTLELGGGGSAVSALGSVTMQVQCELAADLRRLLIASQVAGSASFESRLVEYSEQIQLPATRRLPTIPPPTREYGPGVVQGGRAPATDLRRAQRRGPAP